MKLHNSNSWMECRIRLAVNTIEVHPPENSFELHHLKNDFPPGVCPVVAIDDSIRIEHRDKLEDEQVS